jgi:alpha-amylase/alpha-mannosidase (GH57 family)
MGNVQVAFLWHFHQPCYRDLLSGKILLPWVRLHGVKDYTGLAALLEEFPKIRCTANFSPVLLDQVEAYGEGATDTMLDLSLRPASSLTEEQKEAILATFFFAHRDTVIGAFPRYREILGFHRAGKSLREQDFRDLQVLANLAWFHPTVRAVDDLRRKGRGYEEADKQALVALTRETLAAIVSRWKALGERVELSVSPYYHPIIPLLLDFASAREAIPDLPLPKAPSLRAEAEVQVRRALEAGERRFGRRPEGMWPSEGSVSQEACVLFERCGVKWVATDQGLLGEPGVRMLGKLKVAFRDTALSNLLSFTYQSMEPEAAARDFVSRLESRDGPVPVCLDGENPWEHYPGGGVPFLRALFRELSDHPRIRTVTMSELESTGWISRISAGSWINRNFAVWIGHEEDRRGWELLGRAVEDLKDSTSETVWECLRAAEGSDWFWWFGEDYTSAQDMVFDALFRRHLQNAYLAAGRASPETLTHPVKRPRREVLFEAPGGLLSVRVDGRLNGYFEWNAAGRYDLSREYSVTSGDAAFIRDVYYGFDLTRLFIRIDFRPGVDPRGALEGASLRVVTTRPRHKVVPLEGAVGEIYEAGVPFGALDISAGDEVEFFVEIERKGAAPLRIPTLAPLWFRAPTADFKWMNWQV